MNFYEMSGPERASIIRQIAWTLCNGDDQCIHVSNVARDILEERGISEEKLYYALNAIAYLVEDLER